MMGFKTLKIIKLFMRIKAEGNKLTSTLINSEQKILDYNMCFGYNLYSP